jgi:hypothetical protein
VESFCHEIRLREGHDLDPVQRLVLSALKFGKIVYRRLLMQLNPNHPMAQFAQENAVKFLACIIWKLRAHCPNLSVEITTQDMAEVAAVFFNSGKNGHLACRGKKDSVVLQLVDQETGEALAADPTMDELSPNAVMMRKCMAARKRAPELAERMLRPGIRNVNDEELMREAAEVLKLLTWEPEA